jgi:hypothetical protein
MAAGQPLSRLALAAASAADDVGYVALADLSQIMGRDVADYRVIGGHTVTILAARWRLGPGLYRETGDVELGIPPVTVRDHRLVDRLKARGYDQVEGNRFARTVPDTLVTVVGGHAARQQCSRLPVHDPFHGRCRQAMTLSNRVG